MKRVLMISYDFPPSSIGIWRTLKYCRYLPEFGWRASILTTKEVRSPRFDYGPLNELPRGTAIRRTESFDQNRLAWLAMEWKNKLLGAAKSSSSSSAKGARPTNATFAAGRAVLDVLRRWVLVPDDRAGWIPFAMREGRRWLRTQRFDAIYSTSFPNSSHVVATRLAREFNLPYVADFRDIWIGNYYFYDPATRWHDAWQRTLERECVDTAGAVISATRQVTDDFLERYPRQSAAKFHTITNGFDSEDFAKTPPDFDRDHFTITYAGTMYGSTSPEVFFRGVRSLLQREPRWRDVLRLRFIGTMIEPYERMIARFGLSDITRVDPYLAHDEALRVMAEADMLLLLVAEVPGSHIMLTQKVFEYAAARRPVFGLVPEGAADDFLREINEGPIVRPRDVAGVRRALRSALVAWDQGGRKILRGNPALARYARRELTRRLAGCLDQIT